jgi:hypothetical protein
LLDCIYKTNKSLIFYKYASFQNPSVGVASVSPDLQLIMPVTLLLQLNKIKMINDKVTVHGIIFTLNLTKIRPTVFVVKHANGGTYLPCMGPYYARHAKNGE